MEGRVHVYKFSWLKVSCINSFTLGKVVIFFCITYCAWCFVYFLRGVFWEASKILVTAHFFLLFWWLRSLTNYKLDYAISFWSWKYPKILERSTLSWYYLNFVQRSTLHGCYPHFTEISTFRGYWPLVRTFPASIYFCDLYRYVPRISLSRRRHSSLCSGIAARRRHRVMCLFINQELESSIFFLGFTSFVTFSTDIESSWHVELGGNLEEKIIGDLVELWSEIWNSGFDIFLKHAHINKR